MSGKTDPQTSPAVPWPWSNLTILPLACRARAPRAAASPAPPRRAHGGKLARESRPCGLSADDLHLSVLTGNIAPNAVVNGRNGSTWRREPRQRPRRPARPLVPIAWERLASRSGRAPDAGRDLGGRDTPRSNAQSRRGQPAGGHRSYGLEDLGPWAPMPPRPGRQRVPWSSYSTRAYKLINSPKVTQA